MINFTDNFETTTIKNSKRSSKNQKKYKKKKVKNPNIVIATWKLKLYNTSYFNIINILKVENIIIKIYKKKLL